MGGGAVADCSAWTMIPRKAFLSRFKKSFMSVLVVRDTRYGVVHDDYPFLNKNAFSHFIG